MTTQPAVLAAAIAAFLAAILLVSSVVPDWVCRSHQLLADPAGVSENQHGYPCLE